MHSGVEQGAAEPRNGDALGGGRGWVGVGGSVEEDGKKDGGVLLGQIDYRVGACEGFTRDFTLIYLSILIQIAFYHLVGIHQQWITC